MVEKENNSGPKENRLAETLLPKIVWWSVIGAFIITVAASMISHYYAPQEIGIYEINLNMPFGATKIDNFENINYEGIERQWNETEIIPITVNNISVFGVKSMDEIYISFQDKLYMDDRGHWIWKVYLRGINQNDLPIVYDYTKNILVYDEEQPYSCVYCITNDTASLSEKTPWTLNIKVSKSDNLSGVFVLAVLKGMFAAFVVGVMGFLALILFEKPAKK